MQEISSSPEGLTPPEPIQLYQKLLECLEKEWQALVTSQEDAILTLAAEKEQILAEIVGGNPGLTGSRPNRPEGEQLQRLKDQVTAAQSRNQRLIVAALETVQDFLRYLKSAPPGIYQAAGKVKAAPGSSYFHRQA
jgi:flagellar biosynthesis/type III secretory pathway chaperone